MKYVLDGNFLDLVEKVEFLNENGIVVYMDGGQFVIPDRKSYFDSLILLFFNGYITDKELISQSCNPIVKDYVSSQVLNYDSNVCIFESIDKYLLINKKDDGYNVIVKDCTNDLGKESYDTEFYFESNSDITDVFKILYKFSSQRIYSDDSDNKSSYMEIENDGDVFIFRVVRKENSNTNIDKNTSMFNFKGTEDCAKINFLFNELKEKSCNEGKIMLKSK